MKGSDIKVGMVLLKKHGPSVVEVIRASGVPGSTYVKAIYYRGALGHWRVATGGGHLASNRDLTTIADARLAEIRTAATRRRKP